MSSQNPKGVIRFGWLGFMLFLAVLYLQEGTGQPGGIRSRRASPFWRARL